MLEELSKRDNEWRRMALSICGNKMLADDLVQQMYLRVHKQGKEWKEVELKVEFYVWIILRNSFYSHVKESKKTLSLESVKEISFEQNQDKKELFRFFSKELDNLRFLHKEILLQNIGESKSMRKISKEHNINLMEVFYTCKIAKQLLQDKFYKTYNEFKN